MLTAETKRHIDAARQVLVGVVPNPMAQIDQITNALIYKFMDDMDRSAMKFGGKPTFFTKELESYSWSRLMAASVGHQERMNRYSEALLKFSTAKQLPELFRDIFKSAFLPYRSPEVLGLFLKEIEYFDYSHSEELGNAFEYLLSIMGSQGDAGQFRTPRHIIDFIVKAVDPTKDDKVLDPACGTAGFLISAYKHILRQHDGKDENGKPNGEKPLTPDEKKRLPSNFQGYDVSPDMVRLSQVNMYLHQFKDPHVFPYNTLAETDRWKDKFDVILANPPFMSPKGGVSTHDKFSVPSTRSEVLFVDYIMQHLTPTGRAGIIVPEGIIFQSGTAYRQLRKLLVEDGLYAVVSLPSGVFQPYSGVKTSILFFDNQISKQSDEVLFIKILNDGFDLGAQRRPRPDLSNDLTDEGGALEVLRAHKKAVETGKKNPFVKEDSAFAWLVKRSKIAANGDYNLSGERYREGVARASFFPTVPLGEVCDLIGGGTPSKQDESYWLNGTVKWISSKHIDERGSITGYELISKKAVEKTSTRIAPKGSTIIITRVSVGKFAYVNEDYAINQDLTALVSKNNERLDPEFIRVVALHIAQAVERNAEGIGVRGVTRSFLSGLKIPLPPLKIQKEIVAEIEGYQKVINGARAVLDHYRPHIPIHPDWPMVEFGDASLFRVESGGTPKSDVEEYWGGGIPWATLVDLPATDFISEITTTKRTISDKGLRESSAKMIPANSIVVSTRATIGRIAINRVPIATNQGFKNVVIEDPERAIPEYVALVITKIVPTMEAWATGGTFAELSKAKFCELQIPLPPLATQQAIVAEIEAEQALVAANRELIARFEQKIQATLARVWGEDTKGQS